MRFSLPINVSNQKPDQEFVKFVAQTFDLLQTILNGNIEFVGNCKTGFVPVTFTAANVTQAVPHRLGKVPIGILVGDTPLSSNPELTPTITLLAGAQSGTYTPPSGVSYLKVRMVGAGGGGGGGGTAAGSGVNGTNSTFGTYQATRGVGGTGNSTGATAGTGTGVFAISGRGIYLGGGPGGGGGTNGVASQDALGGSGGISDLGGAGPGNIGVGSDAVANSGSGGAGGGAGSAIGVNGGAGGASGQYLEQTVSAPATSYAYTVGLGGTGGAAGSSAGAAKGGAGGDGTIEITEYYFGNPPPVVTRDATQPSNTQYIYLKASVAGQYKVMIF